VEVVEQPAVEVVGCQRGPTDDKMLAFFKRHGVDHISGAPEGGEDAEGPWPPDALPRLKERCDKAGIARYGWATLPMDEARATVTLDLCGRQYFVWKVPLPKAKLGTWDTELAEVFFEAFARGAACNLHVVLHEGDILHHIVEIC